MAITLTETTFGTIIMSVLHGFGHGFTCEMYSNKMEFDTSIIFGAKLADGAAWPDSWLGLVLREYNVNSSFSPRYFLLLSCWFWFFTHSMCASGLYCVVSLCVCVSVCLISFMV